MSRHRIPQVVKVELPSATNWHDFIYNNCFINVHIDDKKIYDYQASLLINVDVPVAVARYWMICLVPVELEIKHDRKQNFSFLPIFTPVDRAGRSTSLFHL